MDDLEREYSQRLEDFNQENGDNFEVYEKTSQQIKEEELYGGEISPSQEQEHYFGFNDLESNQVDQISPSYGDDPFPTSNTKSNEDGKSQDSESQSREAYSEDDRMMTMQI